MLAIGNANKYLQARNMPMNSNLYLKLQFYNVLVQLLINLIIKTIRLSEYRTIFTYLLNIFYISNKLHTLFFGAIAQLGEHLLCKQEVVGSIPTSSTKSA